MTVKFSNSVAIPFIHVQGIGSMVVDRMDIASRAAMLDSPAFCKGHTHAKIYARSDAGIEVTISGDSEKLNRSFPIISCADWNGEGEPVPGQRVRIDDEVTGVVVLVGDFKLDKQRGAIIQVDGAGHLTMPMIISSLKPIERQLTDSEKKQIEAIHVLMDAEIIGVGFGYDEIERINKGTKS